MRAEVFASLGSNQDREHNIREAVKALRVHYGALRLSPVYQNKAVGFDGEDFLNMVVAFRTDDSPEAVQQQFRHIEDAQGRTRSSAKFAPRQLDIDLILYDDLVRSDEVLSLPRKDIETYGFVLLPLADLAPDAVHPVLNISYAQMWQSFTGDRDLKRIELVLDAD